MNNCRNELCVIGNIQETDSSRYGLSKYGFRRKLFPKYLADGIARAKKAFGVNIDTSETSFLGKLVRNLSRNEAYLWESAENVCNPPFVDPAQGTALDDAGMYLTISRRPATRSKVLLKIYGDKGTKIPKGFQVATKDNVPFETLEEAVIAGESVEVSTISLGAGKRDNVSEETITEVINPTLGIDRVVSIDKAEGGLGLETDSEFRERYKKSYSRVDGSMVPAIYAALLDIDKMVDCEVRENMTMETIGGIPPKSMAAYVYRGEDQEVAQAIFENRAAEIQTLGSKVVKVTDEKGESHSTGFTRAQVQDIWVKLIITKDKDYKEDQAVKRTVLNYIGGRDLDGTECPGLRLGEDVIQSKVLGQVMCMGGMADIKAHISKDGGSWQGSNIPMARAVITKAGPEKVVVEYVS